MTTNKYVNRKFEISFELSTTSEGSLEVLKDLWNYIQNKDWAIDKLNGSATVF